MIIKASEIQKGMTVTCTYGGKQFKVGKVEKDNIGRIVLYNTRGKHMHSSGKAVKYVVS